MALSYSWNTIASSQTDADSPLDETLMEAIRQNLITLKESMTDSGSTYTIGESHDHDGTNSKLYAIPLGSLTSAMLSSSSAGSYIEAEQIETDTTTNTSYTASGIRIKVGRAGTYTVEFQMKNSVFDAHYARIYKNGSPFGSEHSHDTTSYVTKSQSLTLASGDYIEIYHKDSDGDSTSSVKDLKLRTGAPFVAAPYN